MTERTIIPVEQRAPRVRRTKKNKPRELTLQERNDAFHAMMQNAVQAGAERIPSPPTAPADTVIARPFAPAHVATASNCSGF